MRSSLRTVTALALSLLPLAAQAATVLTIGRANGYSSSASGAAAEFVAPAGYTPQFLFDAGTLPMTWRSPAIPGEIAADAAYCSAGHDCTSMLNIKFTVPASLDGFDFDLKVDRFGSEWNAVFVDGVQVGGLSATEGGWMSSTFDIGILYEGQHSIMLWSILGGNIGSSPTRVNFLDRIVLTAE